MRLAASEYPITSEREWLTQLCDQFRIAEFGRAGLGDDDEIASPRQTMAVKPHEFPQTPLDSVAHHRVADAATDAESEPRGARS